MTARKVDTTIPIAMANESVNKTIQRESKMNFNIEYNILNGLTYWGNVNMNIRNTKGRMFLPQVATGLAWTDSNANRPVRILLLIN